MKYIKVLLLVGALTMAGCASTITITELDKEGRPTRIIQASDYSFKEGKTQAAPNRWFTTSFLGDFFKQAGAILGPIIGSTPKSGDGPTTYYLVPGQ